MKKIVFSALLASAFALPAVAQTPAASLPSALSPSLSAPASGPVLAPPSAAAMAAAKDLMEAMHYRQMMADMVASMSQSMPSMVRSIASASINGNAKLSDEEKKNALSRVETQMPVALTRMDSFMSDPALIEEMMGETAALYARHFSAAEIEQITAFYKTAVGAKMLASTPQIMNESMAVSQKVLIPRIMKMAGTLLPPAATAAANNGANNGANNAATNGAAKSAANGAGSAAAK